MAKIVYLEDTITRMANTKGGLEYVQKLAKLGEFKQTQNGYRYIILDDNKKNELCPIHGTLLNEDGFCNKCLEENNK